MGVQEVGEEQMRGRQRERGRNKKSPKNKSMGEWRVGGARSRRNPVEIQRPARMAAHGGVDGGRSHGGDGTADTRGPTDGDDAGGVGAQVGAEQPQSLGDTEDPEGLGGAGGSGE